MRGYSLWHECWPRRLGLALLLCGLLVSCAGDLNPALDGEGWNEDAGARPDVTSLAPDGRAVGDAGTDGAIPEPPEPRYALDCTKNPGLLHPLFGSHMVLQRNAYVPIWGCTKAGGPVSVAVAGQTVTTTADSKGFWKLRLKPVPAGGPHTLTVVGEEQRTLMDVLFGDVWLCSGQSNMNLAVSSALNAAAEAADADQRPTLRLFKVTDYGAPTPQDVFMNALKPVWQVASSTTVPSFSAACYFYARELQKKLAVPMGLIQSSVGGTKIEHWMSATALAKDTDFASLLSGVKTKAAGTDTATLKTITFLFNGKIAPLRPFALRAAIWYQGESNASLPAQYKRLLPALVDDWRSHFGQAELPFLVVQLPRYKLPQTAPVETGSWAGLREAQLASTKHPHVGLAVTIDTGMVPSLLATCAKNRSTCLAKAGAVAADCETAYTSCVIHPTDKQDVGSRLALTAAGMLYGQSLPASGPTVKSAQVQGQTMVITFAHAESGLMAGSKAPLQAVKADALGKLTGFAIAGADKVFRAATATIKGSTVVVSSPAVAQPAAVRYGWGNNPPCNLYSKAGLPASPFRTDTWSSI